ncbi:MAG: hypothetical protein ACXV2B_08550 [Halobacteriota archaeon]
MEVPKLFGPEKALDTTPGEYVLIRYEEGKTYTYTAYNKHAAGFLPGNIFVPGAVASQHAEHATGSDIYSSINAATGQAGDSEAFTGMQLRLFGLTPVIHNDPKRTCTLKVTLTYTLTATGDKDAAASVVCMFWGCPTYSDTVTGAQTMVTKTVTKTVTGTCPLKKAFWVTADGIKGLPECGVISRNTNTIVPEQVIASATVSSISLTFNPVKIIPEPF